MNTVQIMGHLGGDAEERRTSSGQKVSSFTVATNNRRGDKEETVWWRVTVWGDRFDRMMPYLKKGSAIIVTGELKKPEIWTGQDGQPRVTLEITAESIKFSPFGRGQSNQQEGQTAQPAAAAAAAPAFNSPMSFGGNAEEQTTNSDDNIPF